MPKLIIFILLLFISNFNSFGCSCGPISEVKEAVEESEYVIYGKVIDISFVPGYSDYWYELITSDSSQFSQDSLTADTDFLKATILVIKTFKGNSELDTITVYTDESERSCGVNFKPGDEYVIYGSSRAFVKERYNYTWPPLQKPEKIESIWTGLCTRTTNDVSSEISAIEEYILQD